MKRALPINSKRFISGETCGIYLFNIRPAKNAPKTPSIPTIWESAALMKSIAITKINCITASLYRRKNQRVKRGISMIITAQ